jgi:hypothetical protein
LPDAIPAQEQDYFAYLVGIFKILFTLTQVVFNIRIWWWILVHFIQIIASDSNLGY